jgi:hypothetical protein
MQTKQASEIAEKILIEAKIKYARSYTRLTERAFEIAALLSSL